MSTPNFNPPLSWPNFGRKESPGNYQPGIWELEGTTFIGQQKWKMATKHCRDVEDNDISYTIILGPLSFYHSDDMGRDFGSKNVIVEYTDPTSGTKFEISNSLGAGRSGYARANEKTDQKGQILAGIHAVAAKEGMSARQLVAALPSYYSDFLLAKLF